MKSLKNGRSTSGPEITNISVHGFWLWFQGTEYFLPFSDYPWFRKATIKQIINVKQVHKNHFYWPELDVDLTTDILSEPEKYPLVWRAG
jgi:hypothetical protein